MHRQKTIAKWLAVVVLITVAVACYIIFGNFDFNKKPNNSHVSDAESPQNPEPPHVPYYSELPREAEIFGNVTAAHVGGEGEERAQKALFIGNKIFLFFSSDSEEYDVKGAGLYLAKFENGELLSVEFISSASESVADAKPTASGFIVLTTSQNGVKLYKFTPSGTPSAKREIDVQENSEAFKLHLFNSVPWLFYISDSKLEAGRIGEDLSVDKSAFFYPVQNETDIKINQIFTYSDKMNLIISYGAEKTEIVEFSPFNGFKQAKVFDKMSFLQFGTVSSAGQTDFIVLGSTKEGLYLTTMNARFETLGSAYERDSEYGVFFVKNNEITLVSETSRSRYCRHLDMTDSVPLSKRIKPISAYINSKKQEFILIREEDGFVLRLADNNGSADLGDELLRFDKVTDAPVIAVSSNKINAVFTSSAAEGICHMNFGATDAFAVTVLTEA